MEENLDTILLILRDIQCPIGLGAVMIERGRGQRWDELKIHDFKRKPQM